jgi:hypothetical protein
MLQHSYLLGPQLFLKPKCSKTALQISAVFIAVYYALLINVSQRLDKAG